MTITPHATAAALAPGPCCTRQPPTCGVQLVNGQPDQGLSQVDASWHKHKVPAPVKVEREEACGARAHSPQGEEQEGAEGAKEAVKPVERQVLGLDQDGLACVRGGWLPGGGLCVCGVVWWLWARCKGERAQAGKERWQAAHRHIRKPLGRTFIRQNAAKDQNEPCQIDQQAQEGGALQNLSHVCVAGRLLAGRGGGSRGV